MVDEYLSEREQAEQLRHWFRANWIWMFSGVALAVGGWYGWQWWQAREATRSLEAESKFTGMLSALTMNNVEEGRRIGTEITTAYADTPYADQAALMLARMDVEGGGLAQAETRLATVANSSDDPDLRLVARLRLARVQLAQGRHDDALATIEAARMPAVDARIEELRGDVLLARGDRAAALEAYRKAQAAVAEPSMDGAQVDAELLGLKIDELTAAAPAARATE